MIRTDYGTLRENLTIPQGVYWRRAWPVTDPLNGTPLAIGGWSARAQIRDNPHPGAPVLFEWNTESGTHGAITLVSGLLTIALTGSESLGWPFRRGFFDLFLTDPSGHPSKLVEGRALIVPAITHDN